MCVPHGDVSTEAGTAATEDVTAATEALETTVRVCLEEEEETGEGECFSKTAGDANCVSK